MGEVWAPPRAEAGSGLGPQDAWDRAAGPPAGRREVPLPAECPSLELWARLHLPDALTLTLACPPMRSSCL